MRRALIVGVVVLVAATFAHPLRAYLKIGTFVGDEVVGIQWTNQPIKYLVTNRDAPGVTAAQFQMTLAASFASWSGQPDVALNTLFVGFTGLEPSENDVQTVIGFQSHPELDRTLGATTFTIDDTTGTLLASDIFLNTAFQWSVASNGEPNRFDVQSILTHEVGHLLGLGHSAIGETLLQTGGGRSVLGKRAVMFPIAYPPGSVEDRAVKADDIAGITDIYGTSAAQQELGAISGRVTLNGAGVFGAHVLAFNPANGDMVSGFTLTDAGEFVIAALKPGHYVVRVEPLDDADIDGFFDEDSSVNINFQVTYYAKLVVVPAGGASGAIQIKVKGK
jgi:hypothetical protein